MATKQSSTPKIVTKKHIARLERERQQVRLIQIISITAIAIVVLLVGYGILDTTYLKLRKPVAVVNGEKIALNYWQERVQFTRINLANNLQQYQYYQQNIPRSTGERLEYWQKSLGFFADAPLTGHGTGSIQHLFEQAAAGQTGLAAEITKNPHNQTLSVAVQWGIAGIAVLYAMWMVHLLLFRGQGLANWIGLLVVVQNLVSSLFNAHLFDFVEGWMYVLGVGIAGGMSLGARRRSGESRGLPVGNARAACVDASGHPRL